MNNSQKKTRTLVNLFCICVAIATLFYACYTKPQLNQIYKCKRVCNYLEERKIKYPEFVRRMEYKEASKDSCNYCPQRNFCGITLSELIQGMQKYRDDIWWKNCTGPTISSHNPPYTSEKYNANTDKLDARFVEIDIRELENYLCYVKQLAKTEESPFSVSSIRFYYIKYPETIGSNPSNPYAGCHSIALVPVNGNTGQDFVKDKPTTIFVPGQPCMQTDQSIANHNQLCPPMTSGCNLSNTLIALSDQ